MRKLLPSVAIALAAALPVQDSRAGGFIEIEGAAFAADSNQITNAWWPLPEGIRFVYFAEGPDGCTVDVLDVLPTASQSRTHVAGVAVREVLDEAWLDEDCDLVPEALLETTLDWYAQDTEDRVWYFGEATVSFDFDECDQPDGMGGCTDGSWEAGEDIAGVGAIAEEGIIMLADPTAEKGVFYFQEFYEDEATDMAKILNVKPVDTLLYGEVEGCAVIKEWAPMDPGSIEHKYYCEGLGLVRVQENAGGKTLWVDLIHVGPTP